MFELVLIGLVGVVIWLIVFQEQARRFVKEDLGGSWRGLM